MINCWWQTQAGICSDFVLKAARAVKTALIPMVGIALLMVHAPSFATALYTAVQVSDAGLVGNSLASGNTSRKLAVGADGTVYALFHGANGIRVASSNNRGASFNASVQVSTLDDEAEIAVASTGIIYVAWVNATSVEVAQSTDGGVTYSSPVTAGTTNSGSTVHMATDANYVYLIDQTGNNFLRSEDNGLTFATVALNANQAFSDVHIDPNTGNVVLQVDNPLVRYYVSTDHGVTFSAVHTPNPGGNVFYSVGTFSSGSSGRFLLVAGGGSTALSINIDTNASTAPVFGNNTAATGRALAADQCGEVVDGYVSGTNLQFHVSGDLGSTFGTNETVASVPNAPDQLASVFIDQTTGNVLFLYSQNGVIYLSVYNGELGCFTPQVSASSLDFSALLVGQTSAVQTDLITNSTSTALSITSIAATGDFAQTSNCPATLAAGASCTVSVTFTPTASGTRTGQISLVTSASASPRIIYLAGTGETTAPVPSFSPSPLHFGNRTINADHTATLTLSNAGNATLDVTTFTEVGPFTFTQNCPSQLAAAQSCQITVHFDPNATGNYVGILTLASNALGAPASVQISGSGVVGYSVTASASTGGSVSPSSVNVAAGNTQAFTITPSSGYQIGSVSGCGGTLQGATYTTGPITGPCSVTATFVATSYQVTVSASSNGTVSPGSVSVTAGHTQAFTITPSSGYQIGGVSGCGGTLQGTTYTTGPITGPCSVTATFNANAPSGGGTASYQVTVPASPNGSLSPSSVNVTTGHTQAFTITADSGYEIASVSGCGGTLHGTTYTTGPIEGPCSVTATFKLSDVVVQVTGKGGGGAFDWISIVGLLGIILARNRSWFRSDAMRPSLLCAAVLATGANVGQASEWYAGTSIGAAQTNLTSEDLNRALLAQGYNNVVGRIDDRTVTGWSVYGGYRFTDFLAGQIGFTDLGQIHTSFEGRTPNLATFLSDASSQLPHSADGVDLLAVGRLPLGNYFDLRAMLGAYVWEADKKVEASSGESFKRDENGVGLTFGTALDLRLSKRVALTAGWRRFDVGNEHIGFAALGIELRWN
jgi:hypothetical protein